MLLFLVTLFISPSILSLWELHALSFYKPLVLCMCSSSIGRVAALACIHIFLTSTSFPNSVCRINVNGCVFCVGTWGSESRCHGLKESGECLHMKRVLCHLKMYYALEPGASQLFSQTIMVLKNCYAYTASHCIHPVLDCF